MMAGIQLQLLMLTCSRAQERDGDEIYLKKDGEEIFSWQKIGRRFHHNILDNRRTDAFDFRTCKFRAPSGWQEINGYEPDAFTFSNQPESLTIEFWESDEGEMMRGEDDQLSSLTINLDDLRTSGGTYIFNAKGTEYRLTYRLTE